MAKAQSLNSLFNAHTKDLNDFHPGMGDVFVCPICLRIFPREAISTKDLSDGHVWPAFLRKGNTIANSMHVLLCSACNKTSGSRGDKHMQVLELLKDGDETGDLYGERTVQIIRNPGKKPIEMKVKVSRHLDDNSFTVTGRIGKDLNWLEGSPEDQARFREVYEKHEQVTVIVNSYRGYKSQLAPAGWVASAYLMTFYYLGYRYILHHSLDPVRDYILQSFEYDAEKKLVIPNEPNFALREYASELFSDPTLSFVCPLESNQIVYLQVNFLKYEIRLPFRYSRLVFEWWVRKSIPDIEDKLSKLQKSGECLFLPIIQTKTGSNLTLYDFLLGKPIPGQTET